MKKSLPCLTLIAAIIVATAAIAEPASDLPYNVTEVPVPAPAEVSSDPAVAGNRMVLQAAGQLEQHASVTARLRHQVNLGGENVDGIINYWQQGSGEELKVRLELQIIGKDATLLQVCNGRFYWIDRRLPTGRYVSRIDLRQLRADPSLAASNLNDIKPGEANWSALQTELSAYTGGLPTLLNSLNDNFAFLPPQAFQLEVKPLPDAKSMKVPVFAVVGHWRPEKLTALVSKNQPPPVVDPNKPQDPKHKTHKPKPLPERIPEEVLLLVRQSDLFPCRIEYRRLETPQPMGGDGPPIPYQLSVHPMVVLELSEVVFDAAIAAGQFDYTPGDADWSDQTTSIIERLRQQHQAQVAARPAADSATPTR